MTTKVRDLVVEKAAIAFNLPPTNVAFFAGRDGDLNAVHQRLQQSQHLAVSAYVKRMGGVGKTGLAIQYALKYVLTDYCSGVCWQGNRIKKLRFLTIKHPRS